MTSVVNLKKDRYDVYIGRAGKGQDGYFGNPVALAEHNYDRALVIAKYKEYFLNRISSDAEFKKRIEGLKGKILGCFCMPKECHGMIIVEYLEGLTIQEQLALHELSNRTGDMFED